MIDVLVIGAGPAGLSAGLYAKRANLSVQIVERAVGGGQITESGKVDNYLGLAGLSGFELAMKFRQDVDAIEIPVVTGEVTRIEPITAIDSALPHIWRVVLDKEEDKEVLAKTIIYATGATHRHLGVKGEEEYAGKGVSYCAVCDGMFYRNKDVVVVGGGDTAINDALYLSDVCSHVTLVHRRTQFRATKSTVERLLAKENVTIKTPANVTEIKGDSVVTEVTLDNGETLSVNGVFVAVGMIPQTDLVKNLLDMDGEYIVSDETGVTNQEGFFVSGDVRTKALRQVITAVSDGANAAISAQEYLAKLDL